MVGDVYFRLTWCRLSRVDHEKRAVKRVYFFVVVNFMMKCNIQMMYYWYCGVIVCLMSIQRPESHGHLQDGHLALSGLQVRGHAMFSHKDLPLDSETLEYSWLLEVTIGDITGRLTAPQVDLFFAHSSSQS